MKKIILKIKFWWLSRQIDLDRYDDVLSRKLDRLLVEIEKANG